ncbi:MAG TPA: nitroreductase family protein [Ilumatobacteraceae bacterium]|nr:nitroreductase family protein [Ilumatobacteraceae bacterium]
MVRSRRMTRSFRDAPIEPELIDRLVDLGSRSPSAGKTQGWHVVVLEGAATARLWDITLPSPRRESFRWQGLLRAPVIMLPLADPDAYVARYAEVDKQASGLGRGTEAWPVPYWTIDASMAMMTMLLAAQDAGLGALLFGIFRGEDELRASLGIPANLELLGAIALGWPDTAAADDTGLSASRPRRAPGAIIHRNGW